LDQSSENLLSSLAETPEGKRRRETEVISNAQAVIIAGKEIPEAPECIIHVKVFFQYAVSRKNILITTY